MMLDYVKECFIESGGSNLLIDWKESFALINNEVKKSLGYSEQEMSTLYCTIEEEAWDHIWVCPKNKEDQLEFEIFKSSIDKVLGERVGEWEKNKLMNFKEKMLDVASDKSLIMVQEGILRELTRGLKVWNERCFETIELEKQLGIFKDLKRKKKRTEKSDEDLVDQLENNENEKKK
ncbi:uncharacterized protein OCT59_007816 [Rhizophagus irregularis]|nr:hypothetical protein OCT59_007816 [Rhizophagus irregularis]